VSNVVPDSDGYMPHMVFRPTYGRVKDPRTFPTENDVEQSFGNDSYPPEIRMDLGDFYAPYAGEFSIEGGSGPGGPEGTLLISWVWDRPAAKRSGFMAQLLRKLTGGEGNPHLAGGLNEEASQRPFGAPDKSILSLMLSTLTRRLQVDQRGSSSFCKHTFTVYNAPSLIIVSGTPTPTRISRPNCGVFVTTTTNEPLSLDNGPSTYAAPYTSTNGVWQPMGPFQYVYSTAAAGTPARPLIFLILF
jgi:hypothetical protein